MFFFYPCELFCSFIVFRDTMAQEVLWIRLEDIERANKFPITDENMSHDLDDFAKTLCKKGRLKTLRVAPHNVEFSEITTELNMTAMVAMVATNLFVEAFSFSI